MGEKLVRFHSSHSIMNGDTSLRGEGKRCGDGIGGGDGGGGGGGGEA